MAEKSWLDDLSTEEVDVQAVDAFHHGGTLFSASFELSDAYSEFARSYVLEIDFSETITYTIRLQIEDTIRSHTSPSASEHHALELGGIVHHLTPAGDTTANLPNGVLKKIWKHTGSRLFAIGELGVSYVRERGLWTQLATVVGATMNDIHGNDTRPVYVAGNLGLLLQLEGAGWTPIDLGVHDQFNAVSVADSGSVFLGGADGAAFEFVESELIALDSETVDYFGICEFKGRRYWSDANFGLSIQNGNRIEPLRRLGQGFTMSATADYLVIVGWHEFFVFDGKDWTGFELGYDGGIFMRRIDIADYG